jgi:tripeptidyl-peptidase-1
MAVIWMAAANADLWYEDFQGWMFAWAKNFQSRSPNTPDVISISWGWNEQDQCGFGLGQCTNETSQVYVQRTNLEFMKIAAMGTTILVSSGDAGSPGRTNELCDQNRSHINPVFPGGSPWVLSVGATYVQAFPKGTTRWNSTLCHLLECPSGTQEAMTTYSMTGWTSGSGFTHWDETPSWQKRQVSTYLSEHANELPNGRYFNSKGRAYPDVATFGHNCAMYSGFGGWMGGDGTSCSSPMLAGVIAYLNDQQQSRGQPKLGFVNPLLYQIYEDTKGAAFHDITSGFSGCTEQMWCGRNFGFYPTKGWDPVSGLGSPNVGVIQQYLIEHTPLHRAC